MADGIKRWAKRVVNAPEQPVPTVTAKSWISQYTSQSFTQFVLNYLKSLFPFFQWFPNYNIGWLYGDLVAGITVGIVLVPQSMSYAKIATLPVQYGLYSSFVGVFVYAFFATSKDVSIGPVAVMSLEVGNIIADVQKAHGTHWSAVEIAVTLSFICGFIVLGLGLLRLGWLVEFIPTPAIAGYMTGSALTIASQQLPGLFGLGSLFSTRDSAYLEVIHTLQNLKHSTKDAAFGVIGLFVLYFLRWLFNFLIRRYPSQARTFFYLSVMRNAFVIIFLTLGAWLTIRHEKPNKQGNYSITVLKTVPRGLHVSQPVIDRGLVSALGSHLFIATLILLLEHIAIGKSFGRVNGYKINPNQELIAIGVTNTVGTAFSAYPATGSFSRTALKSKCGVRTPAAGWFTGIVVLIALYALTEVFFYIPTAGLSAIIIHAVADLVTTPSQAYTFWLVSPFEFVIWSAGVLVTVFSTIEDGIYTTIALSIALLLIRVARPGGQFLGRVKVHSLADNSNRDIYMPYDVDDGLRNPNALVESPYPGVFIFRLEGSLTYPNASLVTTAIVDHAKKHTRRGKDITLTRLIDRPWNDPGPRRGVTEDPAAHDLQKPLLRAYVLDFAAVASLDTTGVQNLIDTRKDLERWADGPVEFHFADIVNPWVRRALIAGGFGTGEDTSPIELAPVAATVGEDNADPGLDWKWEGNAKAKGPQDVEIGSNDDDYKGKGSGQGSTEGPLVSALTPFFHVDLVSAVRSAETRAKRLNKDKPAHEQ